MALKKDTHSNGDFICIGNGYFFDRINHTLYKNDEEILLSKNEKMFLEILSMNKSRISRFYELEAAIFEYNVCTTSLRQLVYKLRKKMDSEIIKMKKSGYILTIFYKKLTLSSFDTKS